MVNKVLFQHELAQPMRINCSYVTTPLAETPATVAT